MEGVPAALTLDACIVPDEKGTSSSELCILTLVAMTYFALYRVSNALVRVGADNQRRVAPPTSLVGFKF